MSHEFPADLSEKILKAAKEVWRSEELFPPSFIREVRLGRRFFTIRHCKSRMVQVKCFTKSKRPGYINRVADATICPVCLSGYIMIASD